MKHFAVSSSSSSLSCPLPLLKPTCSTWGGTVTSLQFVTVGNPGNAADPSTGRLRLGGLHIPDGQVRRDDGPVLPFLNAVAKTDTYGLYNTWMGTAYPTWNYAEWQFGHLHLLGCRQLQPSRQLSRLRCLLGRRGPLLQLVAKRPADGGKGNGHDRDGGIHA